MSCVEEVFSKAIYQWVTNHTVRVTCIRAVAETKGAEREENAG